MAEMLWTRSELEAVFGDSANGAMPDGVTGISIDSRTLEPGNLFFAIRGDRTDGHDYVTDAFARGAALAVVKDDFDGGGGPLLRVPNTLEALNALARAARARSQARILAITGSVGKTGTKEMLRLMLSRLGQVHASDKSYNNHWGVPLSLARLPREADYAVFEIGMNHAGEITPLTRLVRPHAAIITTVAPVHIEFFDSVEGIADAKAEIFLGLEPGGVAILNQDNEHFARLVARAGESGIERIIRFGRADGVEAQLLHVTPQDGGTRVEADCLGRALSFRIGAPGDHLAMNAVAGLAAIGAVSGDTELAAAALADFGAPSGRGAQSVHAIADGQLLLIDEAYNANPASMTAALQVLGGLAGAQAQRRIAVIGDMLELGEHAKALHEALAEPLEAQAVDLVFCCGPHMAALYEALPGHRRGAWAETSEALTETILESLRPGDAVMVKGSLGSRMGPLVEAIKQQYPECEEPRKTAAA